jgi:hypothetical protein
MMIYNVRFVSEVMPDDVVVDDDKEYFEWKRNLQVMLDQAKVALIEGVRSDLVEVMIWKEELEETVWTPERTILVKRPVR